MINGILAILASAPIIILFLLMVWFRWPAVKAMPVAYIITMALVYFVWGVPFNWLLASNVNGLFIALQILLIVFGELAVWKETFQKIKIPAIALFFAVPLVRLMMDSGNNPALTDGMPLVMAGYRARIFQGVWLVFAPFVGVLGTFISGSNTVLNMLFSLFQYSLSENLGISRTIVVSLQNVGGAIGNMICIHNIITVCATVGLTGIEGLIIKRNIVPVIIYAVIAGITGFLIIYAIGANVF